MVRDIPTWVPDVLGISCPKMLSFLGWFFHPDEIYIRFTIKVFIMHTYLFVPETMNASIGVCANYLQEFGGGGGGINFSNGPLA